MPKPLPSRELRDQVYYRSFELSRAEDDNGRAFDASFSSEAAVMRPFGKEVLAHDPGAIDLARVRDGRLPLLAFHDGRQWPIGHVEGFRLRDDRRTAGRVVFAETERAAEPLALHRAEVPLGISMGYRLDWDSALYDKGRDTWTFNRWMPVEVSVTPVEADHSIGFGRSITTSEVYDMPEGNGGAANNGQENGGRSAAVGEYQALQAVLGVSPHKDSAGARELFDKAFTEGWDTVRFARELGGLSAPAAPGPVAAPGGGFIQPGEDARDKYRQAAEAALMVRCGFNDQAETVKVAREGGLGGMPLFEIGLRGLQLANVHPEGNRMAVAGQILQRAGGGHGVGDFDSILANVGNKLVQRGFERAAVTWNIWCDVGSLANFLQYNVVNVTAVSDLHKIPRAGGPYRFATLDDWHEQTQLGTYGAKLGISREALINDDTNTFQRVGAMLGDQWNITINSQVYAALTANPTLLEDSTAVFHADHNNILATAGPPSVATFNEGYDAMANQRRPSPDGGASPGRRMNIMPRFAISPPKHASTLLTLASAQLNPAEGTTTAFTSPNIYGSMGQVPITPVIEGELADDSADQWYMAAAPSPTLKTVTAFFLDGVQAPYVEQYTDPNYDGLMWKVRGDVAVLVEGYRGLVRNAGA